MQRIYSMKQRTLLAENRNVRRKLVRLATLASALACLAACSGCYDAESLAAARRDDANGLKLVEVDVGQYRVTLPKLPGMDGAGVIGFHAFGQVANRDKEFVTEQLKEREPELRHRMLLAVRRLKRDGLEEPDLESLRDQVHDVLNAMLGDDIVHHIGFYDFSYVTM